MIGKVIAAVAAAYIGLASPAFSMPLSQIVNSTAELHFSGRFICSANFIGSDEDGDYFLTAAHCTAKEVAEELTISYSIKDPEEEYQVVETHIYPVDVVRRFEDDDVSVIQTRRLMAKPMIPVQIASVEEADAVQIGSTVMAVGYPKGLEISVTFGTFTGAAQHPLFKKGHAWRADPGVTGGSSGGGFYVKLGEDDYALLGVTSGGFRDAQFMNYFTTPEATRSVLRNLAVDVAGQEAEAEAEADMEELLSEIADRAY